MSSQKPAFPVPEVTNAHGQIRLVDEQGITIRDYFAAAALPAMIAEFHRRNANAPEDAKTYARWAYKFADAMIEEREKKK